MRETGYGREGADRWIKFTILQCDPQTVYFQNSQTYRLHYDFAKMHLDPFHDMSVDDFNQVTLYTENRKAILGAVLWSSDLLNEQEAGIQFAGRDPFDADTIVQLMNQVRLRLRANHSVKAFYFPTYEQQAKAEEDRDYLATQGVVVSSPSRWVEGNIAYSPGWTIGTLKHIPAAQIQQAYRKGELTPDDILLTDSVPAEVPFVAGILSLAPATPSSHVAILANARQIPFVHLAVAADAAKAQTLIDHKIALRTHSNSGRLDVQMIDVAAVDTSLLAEILAIKEPTALNLQPVESYSAYGASTAGLTLIDIKYFGGKAANFGFLRRSIPDHSPVALALSFNLWQEFLDQQLDSGQTLRSEINRRLAGTTFPPADVGALSTTLSEIRDIFTNVEATRFTEKQKNAILELLQEPEYNFDSSRKLRFRSSTNVEDSESFVGAGIYSSYSGCLDDELDADDIGPSLCDASKLSERGVFRAIRKVFASFYNDNAYLERLQRGVDESTVGMAILVHHSFPDEIELANGVGLYRMEKDGTEARQSATLVTQVGALSVSNPVDGSLPEEVEISQIEQGSPNIAVRRHSNQTQFGNPVLAWTSDYEMLANNMQAVAAAFQQSMGNFTFW